MADNPPQNFTNVTHAVWDCLVREGFGNLGMTVSAPQGCGQTARQDTVCWNWNSGGQTLMVQLTVGPWWAVADVQAAVTGCGAQPVTP
ncbi:MAG TPA: hypothetical protein VF883_12110 [Thermoanaerobaculia bacterium]|jgi:hypothetical protein